MHSLDMIFYICSLVWSGSEEGTVRDSMWVTALPREA